VSGAGPPSAAADGAAPVVLDLHGVPCPLSWARARVRLESMAPGTAVDILLDDPRAARDLPRAAESAGHHVVAVEEEAAGRRWRVRVEV